MRLLLSSIPIVVKCHIENRLNRSIFNLDRTNPNRKNSDFNSIIEEENRRNSDFSRVIFLPSSAATAIYILINNKWQQQNRTQLVNLVNFRLDSEKFRFDNFIEHFAYFRFASWPARSFRLAHALRRLRATSAPSSWGVGAQVAVRASASLCSCLVKGISAYSGGI